MALTTYAELSAAVAERKAAFGPKPRPEAERFWPNVDVRGPDECWNWTGKAKSAGYGAFRVGSLADGSRRQVGAHRWICERVHGMTADQHALHHCDNRLCVNPKHLYAGTPADNSRDASDRGRTGGGSMPGADNGNAKLNEAEARHILNSTAPNATLARLYGVSRTQIGHIKSGKSWGYLHGA